MQFIEFSCSTDVIHMASKCSWSKYDSHSGVWSIYCNAAISREKGFVGAILVARDIWKGKVQALCVHFRVISVIKIPHLVLFEQKLFRQKKKNALKTIDYINMAKVFSVVKCILIHSFAHSFINIFNKWFWAHTCYNVGSEEKPFSSRAWTACHILFLVTEN
jgi:hypothetical protein